MTNLPDTAAAELREAILSKSSKISSFEDTPGGRSTNNLADDDIVVTLRLDELLGVFTAHLAKVRAADGDSDDSGEAAPTLSNQVGTLSEPTKAVIEQLVSRMQHYIKLVCKYEAKYGKFDD